MLSGRTLASKKPISPGSRQAKTLKKPASFPPLADRGSSNTAAAEGGARGWQGAEAGGREPGSPQLTGSQAVLGQGRLQGELVPRGVEKRRAPVRRFGHSSRRQIVTSCACSPVGANRKAGHPTSRSRRRGTRHSRSHSNRYTVPSGNSPTLSMKGVIRCQSWRWLGVVNDCCRPAMADARAMSFSTYQTGAPPSRTTDCFVKPGPPLPPPADEPIEQVERYLAEANGFSASSSRTVSRLAAELPRAPARTRAPTQMGTSLNGP